MGRGVNKVILVGRLGQDPDMHTMQNGNSVANLSLATSEEWKDKATGEKKERTEWHRVVIFGALADIAGQYLKKGSQAYFEGKLQTRKWTDKDGVEKYSTEVIASEMQMLGGKSDGNQGRGNANHGDDYQAPQSRPKSGNSAPQGNAASTFDNDVFDDDIPF